MKNEVVVNGIKLTRAQVYQALAELDAPDPIVPGDTVRYGPDNYAEDYKVVNPEAATQVVECAKKPDKFLLFNLRSNRLSYGGKCNARKVR